MPFFLCLSGFLIRAMFDCMSYAVVRTHTHTISDLMITPHRSTMPSGLAVRQKRQPTKQPAGVIKHYSRDPKKPSTVLRSSTKYFWYNFPNGDARLVTSSKTPSQIPQQVNAYIFDPSIFAREPQPHHLPDSTWPPQNLQDLLNAVGSEGNQCIGVTRYNGQWLVDDVPFSVYSTIALHTVLYCASIAERRTQHERLHELRESWGVLDRRFYFRMR